MNLPGPRGHLIHCWNIQTKTLGVGQSPNSPLFASTAPRGSFESPVPLARLEERGDLGLERQAGSSPRGLASLGPSGPS